MGLSVVAVLASCVVLGLLLGRWSVSCHGVAASDVCCGHLEQCRGETTRLLAHAVEAQQDYRRCLASLPVASASVVRSGGAVAAAADVPAVWRHRRASLLQGSLLDGVELVPRPTDDVDVVVVHINGSDPAWRFARNAWLSGRSPSSLPWYPDNGGLLSLVRSLAAYGGPLRIGAVHVLTVFGQSPSWLASPQPVGVPPVRVVPCEGDVGTAFDDRRVVLRCALSIPGLRESFVLWRDDVALGRTVDRSLFWRDRGSWGPRVVVENAAAAAAPPGRADALLSALLGQTDVSARAPLAQRPLAMSRRALALLLSQVGPMMRDEAEDDPLDVRHLYGHWLVENGLAGELLSARDDVEWYGVPTNPGGPPLQAVLRETFAHALVGLRADASLDALASLAAMRWATPSGYEARLDE